MSMLLDATAHMSCCSELLELHEPHSQMTTDDGMYSTQ